MTTSHPAPTAVFHPQPTAPAGAPATPSNWHQGSLWWDAKSVLVTRPIAENSLATTPHLVVPAEYGRLAFVLSSHGAEAQQLAYNGRVLIQAGDWRGRPALGSRQHYGTARIVNNPYLAAQIRDGLRIKYGARTAFARMAHRLAHGAVPYGDLVALVELHPHRPLMIAP
ncbi:hypothetical protein [Nocardia yamanashiensis]|uniref:hypothetical protein n=1 Tax=Nocardia yamanashiensis TaxID=209247 RepID=UPI00082C6B36|nr:hypothetical protein [Nocardia yamanashiensis]